MALLRLLIYEIVRIKMIGPSSFCVSSVKASVLEVISNIVLSFVFHHHRSISTESFSAKKCLNSFSTVPHLNANVLIQMSFRLQKSLFLACCINYR